MENLKMTDKEIVSGIMGHDELITKVYFYDYCRIAYHYYSKRYELWKKPQMGFYALAHEYYLLLCRNDWSMLRKRQEHVKLSTWMIGGFRYVILEALKSNEKTIKEEELNESVMKISGGNLQEEVRDMIEEICELPQLSDRYSQTILRGILLLGFKGKELAMQWGKSPSAISQKFHQLMRDVVEPYFVEFYVGEEREVEKTCLGIEGVKMQNNSNVLDMKRRVTSECISQLEDDEVFVFGSNKEGMHGGGAAYVAYQYFGAKWGKGVGACGQTYAIPTMQGGVETIEPYVDDFLAYAKAHAELKFLVTRIGCGIAGFDDEDIAPLFEKAVELNNVYLPLSFWKVLEGEVE